MIHHSQLNEIRRDKRLYDFIYPYYGRFSISEVGPTVLKLLGVTQPRPVLDIPKLIDQKPKSVMMFMIDGFGYRHFVKYYQHFPFFEKMATRGDVYPITSVFPSTTPAALTTIHTGLTPQEHGLPEWTVYFEEFDSIIETLPFRTWGTEADSLLSNGGNSKMLYEGPTIYQQLRRAGIKSYNFIYEHYAHSAYSRSAHNGSIVVPFKDGEQLVHLMHKILGEEKEPAYFFVYWGNIDSTAHEFGPDTPQHVEAIKYFAELMNDQFFNRLDREVAKDVLFMMTADHGHVSIKGEDIINLNKYPEIDRNLMKSEKGNRILPTGSPHDVFLFLDPPKIPEVIEFLQHQLMGRAEVLTVKQALERGMFGLNQPIDKFLKRIGNVMILPYTHYHVWYEFFPDIPYQQLGMHGGLSEDEMIVPLVMAKLDDLIQ